jgi:hypothetical protein
MRLSVICVAAAVAFNAGGANATKVTGAPAQSRDDLGPLVGIGGEPCSYWTQHRQARDQQAMTATEWLWGYLSAYDQFRVTRNKHLWFNYDIAPVLDFIDRKCLDEPSSSPVVLLNSLMYSMEAGATWRLAHPVQSGAAPP